MKDLLIVLFALAALAPGNKDNRIVDAFQLQHHNAKPQSSTRIGLNNVHRYVLRYITSYFERVFRAKIFGS
jgi:hypothetical protein